MLNGKIGWLGSRNGIGMEEVSKLNGRFNVTLDPRMNGNEDQRTIRVKMCNLEVV